jgi:hypothetical protein
MMQLDKLVLFNRHGDARPVALSSGALNVITGDSRTGKSSLINIIRFRLGSGSPNVPFGPIQHSKRRGAGWPPRGWSTVAQATSVCGSAAAW